MLLASDPSIVSPFKVLVCSGGLALFWLVSAGCFRAAAQRER
jgi:hypothetical protein